jgi:hypothetical protein
VLLTNNQSGPRARVRLKVQTQEKIRVIIRIMIRETSLIDFKEATDWKHIGIVRIRYLIPWIV